MEYFFANSKMFRLHAFLHVSAGSVKFSTKKRPGYCYVAPCPQFMLSWSRDRTIFLFIC